MVNYREILRLHSTGQSQRNIRSAAHCSDHTVRAVVDESFKKGVQWPLDADVTNADLELLLFPDKYKNVSMYVEPDYQYMSSFWTEPGFPNPIQGLSMSTRLSESE